MNIFYLSINEDEERCINIERLREVFRVKDSIGYVYDDGKVSTAKLASNEDAEDAFKTVYNMMNPPVRPLFNIDTHFATAEQTTTQ